jgi:alkaline phosphatase
MMPRTLRTSLVLSLLLLLSLAGVSLAQPEANSAVLFIGDGMGPMQILLGQAANGGEKLALQRLPVSGVVTTLNAAGDITDSADSCTAFSSGHKTADHLGLDAAGRRVRTIAEQAMAEGKSVGIISNDSLWGATPSGFVAHANSRGESANIAAQVAGSGAVVMMGSGSEYFLPKSGGGAREDGRDLVTELTRKGYQVVRNREQLLKGSPPPGARLLGLFEDDTTPTLAEQVAEALRRLRTNEHGFFLIVEQARVDWKPGDAPGVAQDVLALDRAVQVALTDATAAQDTVVVVTADHETGGLLIVDPNRVELLSRIPLTCGDIASHLNADRGNARAVMAQYAALPDLTDAEVQQLKEAKEAEAGVGALLDARAGVKWFTMDHTATPVRLYAFGPGAARFAGDLDNTDIAKRLGRAFESFWAD